MTTDSADRRILIVSEIGGGPPHEGNRARMTLLLDAIRTLEYRVHFAGVNMSTAERQALEPRIDRWVCNFTSLRLSLRSSNLRDRVRGYLERRGWLSHNSRYDVKPLDSKIDPRWLGQLRTIQERERYVRVLVPYVFHSAFLTAFGPECLKVLDTHDIFGERRERLEAAGLTNNWISFSLEDERRGLLRADRVIAIQEAERQYFATVLDGQRTVWTVGHLLSARYEEPVDGSRECIGYLASNNALNVQSLKWFLHECWETIRKAIPEARLLVGGLICRVIGTVPDGVELVGEVDSPAAFYARCVFSVNPMRGGTGLKIKTVESLALGRPVVAFAAGAAGLDVFVGRGIEVVSSADQFAAVAVAMLRDADATRELGRVLPTAIEEMSAHWREELRRTLDR